MTPIKVYLDEDVHHLIAHVLRHRGWDALTTIDAARRGTDDLDQIQYATRLGYTIFSYNVTDFPRLHGEILSAGDHHAGIIVATQENPVANARTMVSLVSSSAEDFRDRLIYLNNFR